MAGLTNLAQQKVLEQLLRGVAYTPPASVHTGHLSTMYADDGTGGVQITASGSGRLATTFGSYASRRISNAANLAWTAGADWPLLVGQGIWDASTGGNLLAQGPTTPNVTLASGDPFTVLAGQLQIDLAKYGPWLAQYVLELLFKGMAKSQVTVYGHLCSTAPSDDGAGAVVITGTGYAPLAVPAWAAYSAGRCYLAADLSYGNAGSAWGVLKAVMWRDNVSPTGGNFLQQQAILPEPTIGSGDPVVLSAASTFFSLD